MHNVSSWCSTSLHILYVHTKVQIEINIIPSVTGHFLTNLRIKPNKSSSLVENIDCTFPMGESLTSVIILLFVTSGQLTSNTPDYSVIVQQQREILWVPNMLQLLAENSVLLYIHVQDMMAVWYRGIHTWSIAGKPFLRL